jgi:hypothetical protein
MFIHCPELRGERAQRYEALEKKETLLFHFRLMEGDKT